MESLENEFFDKFEAAIGNKDLDAMMELMHPDWTMLMHSTGKVLDLNDWKEMFSQIIACLLYTSPSPRDGLLSRMPSSA